MKSLKIELGSNCCGGRIGEGAGHGNVVKLQGRIEDQVNGGY